MKKLLLIIVLLLPGLLATSVDAQNVSSERHFFYCKIYISQDSEKLGTGFIDFTFKAGQNAEEMKKIIKSEIEKVEKMYTEQGYQVMTTCEHRVVVMGFGGGCGLERAEQPMKNITK